MTITSTSMQTSSAVSIKAEEERKQQEEYLARVIEENESAQPDLVRRRLPEVTRARKALFRKLRECLEGCRERKFKVQATPIHNASQQLTIFSVGSIITLSATFSRFSARRMMK